MRADTLTYLSPILDRLPDQWPATAIHNIVCHGHSVPAGYNATPRVNMMEAYPAILHRELTSRFPFSVTNVIVTAIGGETSEGGEKRFKDDVLCHKPEILTIDYCLNDRMIGYVRAEKAWRSMIEQALKKDIKVILLTPSWDNNFFRKNEEWKALERHCWQVRRLADEYGVGLADVFLAFERYIKEDLDAVNLLSHVNHPSRLGHEIIASEILKFFLAR